MRQIGQPLVACDQRRQRLKAHIAFGEMRVGGVDIGGIADDRGEALPGQRAKPVALTYRHISDAQMFGIAQRQRHGVRHHVHRGDLTVRTFAGQRQGNGAGPGAEVENTARRGWQTRQRLLYQTFGIRAGDQRRRGDEQRQRPKLALPDQMSNRFPALASHQERLQLRRLVSRERRFTEGQNPGSRPAGNVSQQDLGVASRAVALRQAGDRLLQPGLKGHHSCSDSAAS